MKKTTGIATIIAIICAFAFFGGWGFHMVADTSFHNPDRGPLPATGILLLTAVLSLGLVKRRAKPSRA